MSALASRDVGALFLETASRLGERPALIHRGERASFAELARDVERLAAGLRRAGLEPGERAALLVPPSRDFYAFTFALFRLGAVPVFVDPGIGFEHLGRCLEEAEPAAFIGSPKAHLGRLLGGWARSSRLSVVADGSLPGLWSSRDLRRLGSAGAAPAELAPDSTAAVLFTSGSTGAPKGAVYTHGMFSAQVELLRELFGIEEGEISVPTFPLFGLFDAALGQTCVIPEMDFTRPGSVDAGKLALLLQESRAHQLFGSPALIDRLGRFGERHGILLPDLTRVMSAGAPVPPRALARMRGMLSPGVQVYTPYGATEALPVALIGSDELLGGLSDDTARGRGVCVGRAVPGAYVELIRVDDGPIAQWSDELRVREGEIGELVVRGPMVSRAYFRRPEADRLSKIGERHRMGDLGWRDEQGRLWFCGRKSQRVGALHTVCAEGVFNAHPAVRRTALVGVEGEPVLCVEKEKGAEIDEARLTSELLALGARHPASAPVRRVLYHPSFPVDIRHNAKIFREKLAVWAEARLS